MTLCSGGRGACFQLARNEKNSSQVSMNCAWRRRGDLERERKRVANIYSSSVCGVWISLTQVFFFLADLLLTSAAPIAHSIPFEVLPFLSHPDKRLIHGPADPGAARLPDDAESAAFPKAENATLRIDELDRLPERFVLRRVELSSRLEEVERRRQECRRERSRGT